MFMAMGKGIMVTNWMIYLWIEVVIWNGWYACLIPFISCLLYFSYVLICMVHLWWRCYVNWCGLVGITLCNMMMMSLSALLEVLWWIVDLIMWSMIISTYIRSNVKLYILLLMLFRWLCRLWLCVVLELLHVFSY